MKRKNTMKNLLPSERPYEKSRSLGIGALSDGELLAVILRTGDRERTSVELAAELLRRFGRESGPAFLMQATADELCRVPGIGPVKAAELLAVAELCRRISARSTRPEVRLNRPESIAAHFMEELCYEKQEILLLVMFDTRFRLLQSERISVGTVNASLASPREIFLSALRHQAVYVVLLHNHPSGDPVPSREDISLTDRVAKAGDLLGIPVMDHIILGDHRYTSFREQGLLPGKEEQ